MPTQEANSVQAYVHFWRAAWKWLRLIDACSFCPLSRNRIFVRLPSTLVDRDATEMSTRFAGCILSVIAHSKQFRSSRRCQAPSGRRLGEKLKVKVEALCTWTYKACAGRSNMAFDTHAKVCRLGQYERVSVWERSTA